LPIIGAPIQDIVSDPEGRLLVAGAYSIARYNADGQLDPTFGSLGTLTIPGGGTEVGSNLVDDVALEPDGKIVAYVGTSCGDVMLDRFYPDGSIDTTFGTNGTTAPITINVDGQELPLTGQVDDNSRYLSVWPDGRILVAGDVTVPNVGQEAAMTMLLPDGTLDTSFNGNGTLYLPPDPGQSPVLTSVVNLVVDQNQILLLTSTEAPDEIHLYQFHLDGTSDTSFGSNGEISVSGNAVSYDFDGPAMAIQPDAKILFAYLSTPQTILSGNEIVTRYNADGSPDPTFGTGGQATLEGLVAGSGNNNI
jgi:uncharacterized delta-60 repeat protein